ncbi:MAG: hypothetical protein KAJ33_02525 [Thermoplasmata archaeon]|nr:hypothetical protein [Thermoplasmata archaeon]
MKPEPALGLLIAFALILSGAAMAAEIELTEPVDVTQPGIIGQQITPVTVSYDGIPYLFWCSNSIQGTGDADFDILYSTMENGVWTQQTLLTETSTGNDHTPQPMVFDGQLYLFWSSDEAAYTGGTDTDIVYSMFKDNSWSQPGSLTATFNPAGDYNPFPVIFNSRLYVFFEWFSQDSGTYEIGSIAYDGIDWATFNITENSDDYNLNPSAAVNGDKLILVWDSHDEELKADGAYNSIISRILDDTGWSNYTSISGPADGINTDPYAVTYYGTTWIFWSTTSESISDGGDMDIVGRTYDGIEWSNVVEEISYGGTDLDINPFATVHNGELVLSWISSSIKFSVGSDTDIVICIFDGTEWSSVIDISRDGHDRDDAGGLSFKTAALLSFEEKLFIIWETNASPDFTSQSNTWLIMAVLENPGQTDQTIYWLALISFVCIGVSAIGLWKFRKQH